jgi:glutamate dehydrogenase/leucine dehydrogenase
LSIALSARSLDECGEPEVLRFYLLTLLDNQRIMLEAALRSRLPSGEPWPIDWFERAPLLSKAQEKRLLQLCPAPGITRDKVKENFWEIVQILAEAKAELPRYTPDPHLQARKEVLERASRAITSAGDVLPSCERLAFFTLPYSYECMTPRLGVVTRKPVSVCGSELRPEAMAAGGVMSVEIFLKKTTGKAQPLQGMTLAIEGLGNAGKHVATSVLQKGASIIGVSDSRGCLLCPDGFSREELAVIIAHKNCGRRLDTLLSSPAAADFSERAGAPIRFLPDPEKLHDVKADILVLAAIAGTIHEGNARALHVSVVSELTGAAVTGAAKRILQERKIHVIPDNLASSGGLLVSLYEMLQNSSGQNWHRYLEENKLQQQLSKSFDSVLQVREGLGVDMPTASDIVAVRRMHDLAIYRERLEHAAAELAQRIREIGPSDHVLVVSDDDEDGVASAAILHTLIGSLNPGAEQRVTFMNESLRCDAVLARVSRSQARPEAYRHVFVLDRALPFNEAGKVRVCELLKQCSLTVVNNHPVRPELLERLQEEFAVGKTADGTANPPLLYISPQTLKSAGRAKEFSTALTLRELAHRLLPDESALSRIDWQAAVASCLDIPEEPSTEWVWFFTQFNPDRTLEAAQAVRLVTRAGGFMNAVQALIGVHLPEHLETHASWHQFLNECSLLHERVQVLVDKIVVENRSRPFTAHFFTLEEVASPTPIAGDAAESLDLHQWISEHLTKQGNLAEKPILVGQVVRGGDGQRYLGVRIRSPRGVDLMEAGLPERFTTGGMPNTAVARIPLTNDANPEKQFQDLVDTIWMKTTHPIYFAASANVSG